MRLPTPGASADGRREHVAMHIMHLDMDAFYASVEQRDDPSLQGKAVIVGGSPESRGVVSACSYEARKFGIHSAMPSYRARQLCPEAIFLPTDFSRYREVSRRIRRILRSAGGLVQPVGLDEAYVQMPADCEDPVALATVLQDRIQRHTRLSCSVGVSFNKPLAKMASEWDKPGGFTVFDLEMVRRVLPDMPLRDLPGVGPQTAQQLARNGITRCRDYCRAPLDQLVRILGKSRAWDVALLCRGLYRDTVSDGERPKSMSQERTFHQDVEDPRDLQEHISLMMGELCERIRQRELAASTLTLKVRLSDFRDVSRSTTLSSPTVDEEVLRNEAFGLLASLFGQVRGVRLMGLTLSNFSYPDVPEQLSLFSQH